MKKGSPHDELVRRTAESQNQLLHVVELVVGIEARDLSQKSGAAGLKSNSLKVALDQATPGQDQ